jgi:site-specific recombinase XerD
MPATNNIEAFSRYITTTRSGATARRYVIAVRMFLTWYETIGLPFSAAPRNTLVNYATSMLEAHYQTSTVRSHLAGVARYLRWVGSKSEIPLTVFSAPDLPSPKRKVKDILPPDTLRGYFSGVADLDEPMRTAALLLPCSGLRCGEMVSLPLACMSRRAVKLEDGTTKDVLTLRVTGKGGHERTVPLLDEGATALVKYLKGWRRNHTNTKWLFPGQSGHIATRTLRKAVQRVRRPSGLLYTPHSMRRTYLTTLFKQGVSPTVLTKIAGHGDVQVLINHYLQLDSDDLAGAVHAAGGKLLKPKGTAT